MRMPSRSVFISALFLLFVISLIVIPPEQERRNRKLRLQARPQAQARIARAGPTSRPSQSLMTR